MAESRCLLSHGGAAPGSVRWTDLFGKEPFLCLCQGSGPCSTWPQYQIRVELVRSYRCNTFVLCKLLTERGFVQDKGVVDKEKENGAARGFIAFPGCTDALQEGEDRPPAAPGPLL